MNKMKTIQITVTEKEYLQLLKAKADCGCDWRTMLFDSINAIPEPRQIGRPARDEMAELFQYGKDKGNKSNPQSSMDGLFGKGWKKK